MRNCIGYVSGLRGFDITPMYSRHGSNFSASLHPPDENHRQSQWLIDVRISFCEAEIAGHRQRIHPFFLVIVMAFQ
jgi:hypothetical protein